MKTDSAPARAIDIAGRDMRSDWVRLRTLILLRWAAIVGQAAALLVAVWGFGIQLDLWTGLGIVSASALFNLILTFAFPANKRLSETEAMLTFLFDVAQLALLLMMTGGLANPFAVLFLGPATIAATTLQSRSSLFVGSVTIALVTLVAVVHRPLEDKDGLITVPWIFEFGFWLAIVIGVVFLGLYARRVATEVHSMGDALLATQMALAREQKLTDLGGVVAATAHELGTPLATIKLVSTELADELAGRPDLAADAVLIREQADRCRDILRSMGQAGKDDLHLKATPLAALLQEAADPHTGRGKTITIGLMAFSPSGLPQPVVLRLPEIVHGLRNLIQNAVDFAAQEVRLKAEWTEEAIEVTISDDGDGFPPGLIGRIGDPYVRQRAGSAEKSGAVERPGYEGMGLGLFIAKTLLERTGARLDFFNGSDAADLPTGAAGGAVVNVRWPRAALEARDREALGGNPRFSN
jgi:two-component system, sensor histidine kinase RegB